MMKALLCLAAIWAVGAIVPERVRFVDHCAGTGNFLFRSGDPSNATSGIAYEELTSLMALRAREAGHALPRKFRLVDLSFWTVESAKIQAEVDFFRQHPDLGEVHHWPMNGIQVVDLSFVCLRCPFPSSAFFLVLPSPPPALSCSCSSTALDSTTPHGTAQQYCHTTQHDYVKHNATRDTPQPR